MNREREQSENQESKIAEVQKRSTPSTNADFARLYNELDVWRRAEIAKVKVPPDLPDSAHVIKHLCAFFPAGKYCSW